MELQTIYLFYPLISAIITAACLGIITAMLAHKKGRDVLGWGLFGFGLAILAISDDTDPRPQEREQEALLVVQ